LAEPDCPNPFYRWDGDDLLLKVLVQPGASHNQVVGIHGEFLRIRLTAPPVEGKANQALIKILSQLFQVRPSRLHIEAGGSTRIKRVRVSSPTKLPEYIHKNLIIK
jgi:uncharacterized protein (TIGR00251 family)